MTAGIGSRRSSAAGKTNAHRLSRIRLTPEMNLAALLQHHVVTEE